jgi:hypothetical protein
MSLSVEKLKRLLFLLNPHGDPNDPFIIIYDDENNYAADAESEISEAIRELIAIKETRPVAYIDPREFELLLSGRTHAYTMPKPTIDCDVPLIRKPE